MTHTQKQALAELMIIAVANQFEDMELNRGYTKRLKDVPIKEIGEQFSLGDSSSTLTSLSLLE